MQQQAGLQWKPKIAKTEEELLSLCREALACKKLPKKLQSSQPRQRWFPGNNQLSFPESLRRMRVHVDKIQRYISSFEYNFTHEKYNRIRKDLGMRKIISASREIIRNRLPIRCVEASFLGAYLTTGTMSLTRFPVHFTSEFNGTTYRHIVLFVEYKGAFGALGLSRKKDLMYKALKFHSLSQLVQDFKWSYERNGHQVKLVAVGLPFSHSFFSMHPIQWRVLKVSFNPSMEDEGVEESCNVGKVTFTKNLVIAGASKCQKQGCVVAEKAVGSTLWRAVDDVWNRIQKAERKGCYDENTS